MEGWSFSICKEIVQMIGKYMDVLECPGSRASDDTHSEISKTVIFRKHMFEYRIPLEQPISITMFRSLRVPLAGDDNKKTLNDVNRLVTRKCINQFSVPECSNNLSSCQLGSSNTRNRWI